MANPLAKLLPARFRGDTPVVPVIRMHGTIVAGGSPVRQSLNFANVVGLIERAFAMKRAPAVAISINSPGGSPVQSRLIYQRIRALSEEKGKPVFVFCEDVAASGGYMIAIAGDEIYADPSSIVGSIGVVSAGFGFTEAIDKLGIERRVYTSGENKMILDPFRPEKQEDVDRLLDLQTDIHSLFKEMVRSRRGDRLADEPDLFSGLFWTGERAKGLGLIDGLGDLRSILRDKFGEKVVLKVIQPTRGLFGRRLSFFRGQSIDGADIAASAATGLVAAIEDRLHWSRYGL